MKGKEIYFKEDPTGKEYSIREAEIVKQQNPTWTIETDDWGYFYRAFAKHEDKSFWEDYDCALQITITTGVVSFFFIISGILNAVKFCKARFKLSCVGLVMTIISLVFLIGGSVQIVYKCGTVIFKAFS